MVMIRNVVIVTMHCPEHVFYESMGMAVVCDHFEMVLNRLDNLWSMVRGREKNAGDEHKTYKGCEATSPLCPYPSKHRLMVPKRLVASLAL